MSTEGKENIKKLMQGKRILVVEDDQYVSRVYTKWLESYGIKVLTANNGSLGLEILQNQQVDLVLLDLGMPGLNGIETLKRIRKDSATKDVKVIILSNTTMTENRDGYAEIKKEGVAAILRKYETSLKELVESIVKCFESEGAQLTSS